MRPIFLFAAFLWIVVGAHRSVAMSIAALPMRIVSCSLASDEILLGLLTATKDTARLVGVSTKADDPSYSSIAPVPKSIAGRCGGEMEALLKLQPDLVILASYNRPEMSARLADAGIAATKLSDFDSLQDILRHITELGDLVHSEAAAAAMVADLSARQARIAAKRTRGANKPRLLHRYPDGAVSGGNTLFDDLARLAGAVNAAHDLKGWPTLSDEALLRLDPDVIVMAGTAAQQTAILQQLRRTPAWRDLGAVKRGDVIVLPEAELGSTSQYAWRALEDLHAALLARAAPIKSAKKSP